MKTKTVKTLNTIICEKRGEIGCRGDTGLLKRGGRRKNGFLVTSQRDMRGRESGGNTEGERIHRLKGKESLGAKEMKCGCRRMRDGVNKGT